MARKKKQPTVPTINISLTEIDLVAKGTELANRLKQIKSLKDQKAEENARFAKLIDEQIELADAIASQILGGSEARNQASLKVGEAGELEVPEKPFAEVAADSGTFPEVSEADRERIEAAKVAEGLKVPPAVADAIAASGGEVDLSAAKAKNGRSRKAPQKAAPGEPAIVMTAPTTCLECGGKMNLLDDAGLYGCAEIKRGCKYVVRVEQPYAAPKKAQPPKAPASEPVTVRSKPFSCPDCGGKIVEVDSSGVFACGDAEGLGCSWVCVVESQDTAQALGSISA